VKTIFVPLVIPSLICRSSTIYSPYLAMFGFPNCIVALVSSLLFLFLSIGSGESGVVLGLLTSLLWRCCLCLCVESEEYVYSFWRQVPNTWSLDKPRFRMAEWQFTKTHEPCRGPYRQGKVGSTLFVLQGELDRAVRSKAAHQTEERIREIKRGIVSENGEFKTRKKKRKDGSFAITPKNAPDDPSPSFLAFSYQQRRLSTSFFPCPTRHWYTKSRLRSLRVDIKQQNYKTAQPKKKVSPFMRVLHSAH